MRRIGNPGWVIALAAAFSATTALHAATSTEIVRVTSDLADQFDPAIRGSLVAYTDLAAGNADIWVYDLNTASYERVGNSAAQQTVEDIDGKYVVFTDNRAGAGQDDIWGYDLDENREFPITTAGGAQFEPAISGDRVVWQDLRTGTSQIWMGSVTGAFPESAVAPSASSQSKPSIHGNLIAWQSAGNVWLRDLSGGAAFSIGAGAQPDVNGTRVAYDNLGNIFVYDYATNQTTQLTNDAAAQRNAHISGDFVVWEDGRSSATNSTDLYGYDLATNQESALVTGARKQFLHDVDGLNIAYTEDDAGNLDVYVLKITVTPDPTPTPSPDPTENPGPTPGDLCAGAVIFAQTYERESGAPETVVSEFEAVPGDAVICLDLVHVSSATVDLNGDRVFSPSDFNANVTSASADVTLEASNTLAVELRGQPGSAMTLRVVAVTDAEAQSNSASLSLGEAGCSVSGTTSSPAGALLLLFGLLGFRRRR